MKGPNQLSLYFLPRPSPRGDHPLYVRLSVNGTRCELGLQRSIDPQDWDRNKQAARVRTPELIQLNEYLQEVTARFRYCYQQLQLSHASPTAQSIKRAYLGQSPVVKSHMTLRELVTRHNKEMEKVLEPGTLKNYRTTAIYLNNYLQWLTEAGDLPLQDLTLSFITGLETYILYNPLKSGDPCTNNGTMKHLERLKKMVNWAVTNGWLDSDPFVAFQLRIHTRTMDFLDPDELARIEQVPLDDAGLLRVRNLFVFSCYTGLAYVDLFRLTPVHLITGTDGATWIRTTRKKTRVPVSIPLLRPAATILEQFRLAAPDNQETLLPLVSNQEINRSLKLIAALCGIQKALTFHLARHTFATTVTLLNGVPIETISKLLGHTKLTTTMVYAHVMEGKVGSDMRALQGRLDQRGTGENPQRGTL